ncbi:MAG: hypothetical protein AAGF12_31175 [Myxococcota bacterium]
MRRFVATLLLRRRSIARPATTIVRSALALSFLGLTIGGHALAEDLPDRLAISVPPCEPQTFEWSTLAAQLEVELRALETRIEEPATLRVVFPSCPEDTTVELVLVARAQRAEATLELDTLTVRALALAVVELVRARWPGLERASTPETPMATVVDALQEVRAAQEADRRRWGEAIDEHNAARRQWIAAIEEARNERETLQGEVARLNQAQTEEAEAQAAPPPLLIGAAATVEVFPSNGASLFGGHAEVELPVGPLRLLGRGGIGVGREDVDVGHVGLRLVSATVAVLSPYTAGRVRLGIGSSITLGWLHAQGETEAPMTRSRSADDLFGWAALELRLLATLPVAILHATLAVGHTLSGFDGRLDERRVLSLRGAVLGVRLGIGFGIGGNR